MFYKGILFFVEFLSIAALLLLTITGFSEGLSIEYPFDSILLFLPTVLIVSASYSWRNKETTLPNFFIFFSIALLFFTTGLITLSTEMIPAYSKVVLFYSISVMVSAILGKKMSWIAACIIIVIGEIGKNIFTGFSATQDFEQLTNFVFPNVIAFLPQIGIVFGSGLIGMFVKMLVVSQNSVTTEVTNSRVGENSITSVLPPATSSMKVDVSDQESDVEKTSTFTVDSKGIIQEYSVIVDNLLDSVVYFMIRNFKSYSALAFIYNPKSRVFVLNSSQSKGFGVIKGVEIPLGTGVIGQIGTKKSSFMSGDLALYNQELRYYSSSEQINSLIAVPIISDQKELLGALALDSKDNNAFRDQDKETLKRFSSLAAALVINARMRYIQERSAKTFKTFYEASHQFTTALGVNEVFDVLFSTVPLIANCTRMMVVMFDNDLAKGKITMVAGNSPDIANGFEFPINGGIYSYAFQNRKLVNIGDYQQYQGKYFRFIPNENLTVIPSSMVVIPIIDDEYRCMGLFSAESDIVEQFSGEIEQTLATLVDNTSVALTRALLYKRMERLATTDGLTGLNNHRTFQDVLHKELERARRYSRPLCLLLLDIDHFKHFNDTYGHPVGDLVLKEMSACICKSLRANDIPARYGGEEFVVVVPETSYQGAMVIAERIRETVENHIVHSLDRELKVTVSIGCATFPDHALTPQDIVECADKALYFSKENGRNRVSLYQSGMGKAK